MTPRGLDEGAVFAQRYRIVRCIAEGGMGAVYEVVHLETERRRALKVMRPQTVDREDLRARFKQEARVAASVESEHIVDVFDAGIDEKTAMPFLVMELLRGEELSKYLRRVKRLPADEALMYLHQTSLALDKTHKARIVHRDLKPENLFLCERDEGPPRIKILDFGIAKIVADGTARENATRALGTPLYMAPEQFRSGTAVSPATDVFALAMIAYTLLVGEPYWNDEQGGSKNVFAFLVTAAQGPQEAPTVRALRSGITLPVSFDEWFFKATSHYPADRFSTASEAVRTLGDALGRPRPGQGAMEAVGQSTAPQAIQLMAAPVSPAGKSAVPSVTLPTYTDAFHSTPKETGTGQPPPPTEEATSQPLGESLPSGAVPEARQPVEPRMSTGSTSMQLSTSIPVPPLKRMTLPFMVGGSLILLAGLGATVIMSQGGYEPASAAMSSSPAAPSADVSTTTIVAGVRPVDDIATASTLASATTASATTASATTASATIRRTTVPPTTTRSTVRVKPASTMTDPSRIRN